MSSSVDVFSWTRDWASEAGLKLAAFETVNSTNLYAKDDTSPETAPVLTDRTSILAGPSLYLAKNQTAGRGRGSNVWISPEGGLLASWSFSVVRVPQPIFAPTVGLALFKACTETWPLVPFSLKAPNDLLIETKKAAGILIETIETFAPSGASKECRTVIGIGMNVAAPPPGVDTATCLSDHLRAPLSQASWRAFLHSLVKHLKEAVLVGQKDRLSPELCGQLCHALNLNPLLKEPIIRVDELGQLHLSSGIVRWQEL